MTQVLNNSSPSRPKRSAAKNALYRDCPSCNKKFLLTEIEFHANLCLQLYDEFNSGDFSFTDNMLNKFPIDKQYNKIPFAPEFYPTIEEFKNPIAYINSIRPKAQKYGLAKIIPPIPSKEWIGKSFTQTINSEDFYFQTKRQNIRQLRRRGIMDNFYCELTEFMNVKKKKFTAIPKILGKNIHLFQLYKVVQEFNGFDNIMDNDLWGKVASKLNLAPVSEVYVALIRIYKENLYDFENSPDKFIIPTDIYKKESKPTTSGMRAVNLPKNCKKTEQKEIIEILSDDDENDNNDDNDNENNNNSNNEDDSEDSEDSDDDTFGFGTGRVYSISSFKRLANRFLRSWFEIPVGISSSLISIEQKETEFWNIINNKTEHCKVQYGSDLDVQSHGSGFPIDCKNPWNLNILPTLKESLLRFLPEHVSGITIPMMYIGMIFSAFCWHVEDDYLYSINYHHYGAPKIWYGVSSYYATKFEKVMKETLPDLFELQPDLLHHLTTMISPLELLNNGVQVVKAIQKPGEFIITFPQAYHGGFNSGFNIAEAVNFALYDWLPFGKLAVKNYKLVKRSHIFSDVELIVNALQLEENPIIIQWLLDAFWKAREEEIYKRQQLAIKGLKLQQNWIITGPLPHSKPCKICNCECYLSAISCNCVELKQYACFEHIDELCSCSNVQKILLVRYSLLILDSIIALGENKLQQQLLTKKRISPSKIRRF